LATATFPFTTVPFFMQAYAGDPDIYYTAADFRRFFLAVKRRPGILGSVDFAVQQDDVVGWSIKVSPGFAHVYGTGNSYLVQLSTTASVSLAGFNTAPAATRTHKVFVAVYDKLISGSLYQGQIVVTEDEGTGAPDPSGAVAFLPLATVTIAKSQSNIQNKDVKNIADHGGSSGAYYDLQSRGMINAGYESADSIVGSAPPRAIFHDGYVRLSGAIGRANGVLFEAGSSHDILSLISALRPRYNVHLHCGGNNGTLGAQLNINPDGTVWLYIPAKIGTTSYTQPNWIYLDGCTYDLD
jgi:hypothetical protein